MPMTKKLAAGLSAHRHLRGPRVLYRASGELLSQQTLRKELTSVPDGIRTRVTGLKGQRPGPLDDGDMSRGGIEPPTLGLKGRCSTD